MKRLSIFILLITLFRCSAITELSNQQLLKAPEFAAYDGLKTTIAVLDFENNTDQGGQKFGSAVADKIVSLLVKSGRFIVIERQRIQEIFQEQALGQSGTITDETAADAGQLLGVQTVVLGNILEVTQERGDHKIDMNEDDEDDKWSLALQASVAHVVFSCRMVDTSTGEIVFASNASATDIRPGLGLLTKEFDFIDMFEMDQTILGNAVRKAVNKMAIDIVNHAQQLEWEGKVVQVKEDSLVYIKPGSNAGIRIGDHFQVIGKSTVLDDELAESIVKGSVEVVGFIGDQVAKAMILEGAGFTIGDLVKSRR